MAGREKFEVWARANAFACRETLPDGRYYAPDTQWCWEAWQAATAQASEPSANLPDVEDMAHSAVQEALSFGLNHDLVHRWMRSVLDKTVAALNAAPARAVEPLTDDEVHDIYDEVAQREPYSMAATRRNIARAIIDAFCKKNGITTTPAAQAGKDGGA